MAKELLDLRNLSNAEIMNGIREDASFDYQQRIPLATQASGMDVVANLENYRPAWNEFLNGFINRIGAVYARTQSWTNPLAVFKKGLLTFGDTVEEYMSDLLTAHGYDPDRDYMEKVLFGQERPAVEVNYHKINRQDFYKFTVNEKMLRRAFLTDTGLSTLIGQLMEAPLKSDQYDEFLIMSNLLRLNEANGGFFKVQVPEFEGINTSGDDAKLALAKMRSMAYRLPILSREFNAAGLPMAAQPDEMVLIGTPDFLASIDVYALAPIFHLDKAEQVWERTVALPREYFGVDGTQAILTTKDFFMVFDTLIENRSQPNPAGLYDNYFLHHHGIYSLSRFVPSIMFTSESGTISISDEGFDVVSVGAITIKDEDEVTVTEVTRGDIYSLITAVTTDPVDRDVAVDYSLTGNKSPYTYITRYGVLYVAGNETSTSITITPRTAILDPHDPRVAPRTGAPKVVNVVGQVKDDWPGRGEIAGITIAGVKVASVEPDTLTYNVALPAGTNVNKGKVLVDTIGSPDVITTVTKAVADGNTTYTITIKVDNGDGSPKSYMVTAVSPNA